LGLGMGMGMNFFCGNGYGIAKPVPAPLSSLILPAILACLGSGHLSPTLIFYPFSTTLVFLPSIHSNYFPFEAYGLEFVHLVTISFPMDMW